MCGFYIAAPVCHSERGIVAAAPVCHSESAATAAAPVCHSESAATAAAPVCHSERSEESHSNRRRYGKEIPRRCLGIACGCCVGQTSKAVEVTLSLRARHSSRCACLSLRAQRGVSLEPTALRKRDSSALPRNDKQATVIVCYSERAEESYSFLRYDFLRPRSILSSLRLRKVFTGCSDTSKR